MSGIIVIGSRRETAPYAAAGLRCFEPEHTRLVERVLAERSRCDVLAMTRRAFEALPCALARDLRQAAWPKLVVLPAKAETTLSALMRDLKRRASGLQVAAA